MNRIVLIGRITKDLELRYTSNNKAVCEFSIAVNRISSDEADFITCQVWEKQAENLSKYQSKGSLISVEGSLRVDNFTDKEGNNRYRTYVLANNIEYLQNKKETSIKNDEIEQEEVDPFAEFGEQIQIEDSDSPF